MKLLQIIIKWLVVCFLMGWAVSCNNNEPDPENGIIQLVSIKIGDNVLDISSQEKNVNIPVSNPITILFASSLDTTSVPGAVHLSAGDQQIALDYNFKNDLKSFNLLPSSDLYNNQSYTLTISDALKGVNHESFPGISVDFITIQGSLEISSLRIGDQIVLGNEVISEVSRNLEIDVIFSKPVDLQTITSQSIKLIGNGHVIPLEFNLDQENMDLNITSFQQLESLTKYYFILTNQIRGISDEIFESVTYVFYSMLDPSPKFPVISDGDLLTLVQQQTFRYFWDFGHPVSGLARERNSSGETVTTGGSGFGIMSIPIGIERGFITRSEGVERLQKIFDFLENADRFHGAWPHWMNGSTGKVIPFSTKDDGGDLVETAFMIQGLLTIRQYLDPNIPAESSMIDQINVLWEGVEWDWYARGENVLYWHWSPDYNWDMNMRIRGYNEALIVYILAASSPGHSINAAVYQAGWANNGGIINGQSYYGYTLPVGFAYGGPLFFAHYSFLGLDPRNLSDAYADYWTQNVNHSLINQAYCVDNPKEYIAYSDSCWGLTASDNQDGYSAHSPTNDLGVITPTAALSSMPYTPDESMMALKFFYYTIGDRLWGEYGFYDAFNPTEGWWADSYIAIDQGPIIVMIENYRTQLLWNLFMSCPEVQQGLDKLGFNN